MRNYLLFVFFALSVSSSLLADYSGPGAENIKVLDNEVGRFLVPRNWPDIEKFLGAMQTVKTELADLNKEIPGLKRGIFNFEVDNLISQAKILADVLDELRPIERGKDNDKAVSQAEILEKVKGALAQAKNSINIVSVIEKGKAAKEYLLAVIALLEKFQGGLQKEAAHKNTTKTTPKTTT